MTERFPGPHSQNDSYILVLTWPSESQIHTQKLLQCVSQVLKELHIFFIWKVYYYAYRRNDASGLRSLWCRVLLSEKATTATQFSITSSARSHDTVVHVWQCVTLWYPQSNLVIQWPLLWLLGYKIRKMRSRTDMLTFLPLYWTHSLWQRGTELSWVSLQAYWIQVLLLPLATPWLAKNLAVLQTVRCLLEQTKSFRLNWWILFHSLSL